MSYGASIAGITQGYKDDPELRARIDAMRAEQADRQGANPAMVTPDAQKQRVARPPLSEVEQPPDQSAQMAALYQMYASQVPQGDTYRSPMTLAARAMSANDQEATPGSSVNGGMPVAGGPLIAPASPVAPVAPVAPGAVPGGAIPQPQGQGQIQPPLASQATLANPAYPNFRDDLFRRKGLR